MKKYKTNAIHLTRTLICIVMLTAFELSLFGQPPVSNPLPVVRHGFVVSAHRGDHTQAPENTLASFSHAIADQVDYVEIDLRTTSDGQLVIMHDASLDRMTNAKGWVKDFSFAEIRNLQVTEKEHPEWGTFSVPSFKEVLALCKDKINIYLDFKDADPNKAFEQICEFGMQRQVVVYINAPHQWTAWRKTAPSMPLMVSLPDSVKDPGSLEAFVRSSRVEILDGDYDQYTVDMVKKAGQLGTFVLTDIQGPRENAALWDDAISRGIRGLQTDHPRELIAYLNQRNLR